MRSSKLLPKSESHWVRLRNDAVQHSVYRNSLPRSKGRRRSDGVGRTEYETVLIAQGQSSHIASRYDRLSY